MKQLKPFLPSLYSEYLLAAPASATAPPGQADHLLGTEVGGDKSAARKMRERSKMKLWREYYLREPTARHLVWPMIRYIAPFTGPRLTFSCSAWQEFDS